MVAFPPAWNGYSAKLIYEIFVGTLLYSMACEVYTYALWRFCNRQKGATVISQFNREQYNYFSYIWCCELDLVLYKINYNATERIMVFRKVLFLLTAVFCVFALFGCV